MSNQPKIIYRSDTTGYNYKMWLKDSSFTIQVEYRNGEGNFTSERFDCVVPWRMTIQKFFDLVDNHINTGKWHINDNKS